MTKRPQIKGKGADVFLGGLDSPEDTDISPTPEEKGLEKQGQKPTKEKRIMVTFYLSPTLVEKLDQAWVERRLKDRKTQKSQIVAEALEAYLK